MALIGSTSGDRARHPFQGGVGGHGHGHGPTGVSFLHTGFAGGAIAAAPLRHHTNDFAVKMTARKSKKR